MSCVKHTVIKQSIAKSILKCNTYPLDTKIVFAILTMLEKSSDRGQKYLRKTLRTF